MNNRKMVLATISIFAIAFSTYIGVTGIMNKSTYAYIDTDGNTVGEGTESGNTACTSITQASTCVARSDCSWDYSKGCTAKVPTNTFRVCLAMADGTYAEECNHFCDVDSSGHADSECVEIMYSVCNNWSTIRWNEIQGSGNQGTGLNKTEFSNKIFTSTETYYCVAGSSIHTGSNSTPPDPSPVDTFEPEPETKTCSYDEGKTAAACIEKAQSACGDKGYTGCYKTDDSACYTYTCKSGTCKDSSKNTHEGCVENAQNVCGSDGYVGCTTPQDGECYTFTCKQDLVTCEDNNGKNQEACRTRAAQVCGDNNYTGCTTTNNQDCYTFTCSGNSTQTECTVPYGKSSGACKSRAQTECGDAGYTGCDKTNNVGCYIYTCNGVQETQSGTSNNNPKTGRIAVLAVWIVGFMSIVYSLWYFKKANSLNN